MNRLSQAPDENVKAILANWFALPELLQLKTEEIPAGMSDARLWRVVISKQNYCLRKTPKLVFLIDQVYELRQVHSFLEYLSENEHHEIARPHKTLKHDTLVETKDAIWELSNFLQGVVYQSPSDEQALAAVECLAMLHIVAANYQRLEPRFASGLKDRRQFCQELVQGKLDKLCDAIDNSHYSPEREIALKVASQVRLSLSQVSDHLKQGCVRLPRQWCFVDCHIGNFLFTGNYVTGLVDLATAHPGSVARDIARLVGSVTAKNINRWRTCLEAYQKHRPLSADELNAVLAFYTSGLIGTAARWLEWGFVSKQKVADAGTTHQKLEQLSSQLASIPDTEAVFAAIRPYQP